MALQRRVLSSFHEHGIERSVMATDMDVGSGYLPQISIRDRESRAVEAHAHDVSVQGMIFDILPFESILVSRRSMSTTLYAAN